MTNTSTLPRLARTVGVPALAALAAVAVPSLASAKAKTSPARPPAASTGNVAHVRGASAELEGSVNPHGAETSYYFRYGPTTAYGQQTPTVQVGKGITNVKVGQTVTNLAPGDHYQLVATNSAGTRFGRDRTYTSANGRLKFAIAATREAPPTPYGGTFMLRGTLTGNGGALHSITVQTSPYPFLTAFANLGTPLLTNAAGAFAVPIPHLVQSIQVRVRTNDLRPLTSPVVDVHVAVRVTLNVRTSSHKGLVRLYGTVTPAEVGAHVLFQLEKPTRPHGRSEREVRYVSQGSTVVRRATRSFSRFSQVLSIRKGGRYRAYVLVRAGALVDGASAAVTLHAGAQTRGHK